MKIQAAGLIMKVSVARIKGPRGFKGELAATLYNPSSQTLRAGLKVALQREDREYQTALEFVKTLNRRVALKMEGIDNEESAAEWCNAEVLVEKDDLIPLPDDAYYHFEIEGAEVVEKDGCRLGIVDSVDSFPANDVLNVRTAEGEIMVPFIKQVVISIDAVGKIIVVRKLEGLY